MFESKDKELMMKSFIVIIFSILVFASFPFGISFAKNEKTRHLKIEQVSLKEINSLPSLDLPFMYSIHEQVTFQDIFGNYRKGTIESIYFKMSNYDSSFSTHYIIKSKDRNFETRESEIVSSKDIKVQIHRTTISNQLTKGQELTLTKDDVITPITVLRLAGIHVYEGRDEIVYWVRNTLKKKVSPYTIDESEIISRIT